MDAKLISVTDFRSNHAQVLADLTDERPITLISRSRPVGVLIHPDVWERLNERLDELAAALTIEQRRNDDHTTVPLEQARKELDIDDALDDDDQR